MAEFIRGGVPREVVLNGRNYTPAEGETITYMLSGRSGAVHIGGDGSTYKESNPHLGGFNQTLAVDPDDMAALNELQGDQNEITGYVTIASGTTFSFRGSISNDGALESDNGNVSLECRGVFEKQ
jgi:hypothetical protein